MSRTSISENSYKKALAAIKNEMVGGLLRAEEELTYQKLLTYWRMGRIVQRDILGDRKEPKHGSGLYQRLSGDLGIIVDMVSQTVRVFNAFPKEPKKDGLNWSHYVMLARVPDLKKRLNLKKRILKEGLTDFDLRRIVKELRQSENFIVNRGRIEFQRGKLYHYRTREIESLDGKKPAIEIDCGFNISIDKPKGVKAALSRGKVIRSVKGKRGRL